MSKLLINSEIKELLRRASVPIDDGIGYLLTLYYDVRISFVPPVLQQKVLSTNIVNIDYTSNTLVWNVSLFEETEIGFEWIGDWMNLFKNVNPDRRGVKADVLKRMKKFFMNNPTYRKEDVFKAAENYLATVSNPIYCKKAHKFIYEIDGTSMLLEYCDQIVENVEFNKTYKDDTI
jgi:hypothetical protein